MALGKWARAEGRNSSKEGRAERVMWTLVTRRIMGSVKRITLGGSGLKWVGNSLGFIGMSCKSDGYVDGKMLSSPLRGHDG